MIVSRNGTKLSGTPEIRAAGGLVWRDAVVPGGDGAPQPTIEVVIIHRPRQDDWSFQAQQATSMAGTMLGKVMGVKDDEDADSALPVPVPPPEPLD